MRFLSSPCRALNQWLPALLLLLAAWPSAAQAQNPYGLEFTDRFRVVVGTDTLRQAWAGGLNSASYSKIDLNGDGVEDLYVHDQTAQRHLTFVATNGPTGWYWRYEPAYESAFPRDRTMFYTSLRDYDGDGRPDLFAVNPPQFWAVYRNVAQPGGVGFRFELIEDTLRIANSTAWLSTSIYGQQSIEDFDNDGDPDILDFNLGTDVFSLYRNQGTLGPGGAPQYVQEWDWGSLVRCTTSGSSCHQYAFSGTFCRAPQPTHGARPDYALCSADLDGDGDRELLIGQQYCRDLGLLVNQGTSRNSVFDRAGLFVPYPNGATPATMVHTPAATYTDLTFDGQPDLLVAPWLTGQESMTNPYAGDQYDTRHAAWLYRRTGAGLTDFQFERNDFLQSEMIDVGNQAAPTLGDLDGDGDLDLLIGHQGDVVFVAPPANQFTSFRAKLAFYRNVGTPQRAVFKLETDDFAGLSALNRRTFIPVLTDLNADGAPDLVLRSTAERYGGSVAVAGERNDLRYIINRAPAGQVAVYPVDSLKVFQLQVPVGTTVDGLMLDRMIPTFADIDADGDPDLLIGSPKVVGGVLVGSVRVFENTGGPLRTAFLYNPALLGVLPGASTGPAPAVADLDGDGDRELFAVADDGEVRVWPDVLAAPGAGGSTSVRFNLVRNGLTGVFGASNLGNRLVVTTGDLDGDGAAEVLVGSGSGGVRLLRHQPNGTTGLTAAAPERARLGVYPNPASGSCTVELPIAPGSPAGMLVSITLRDALGRPVWQAPATTESRQLVPLTGLAPGIYLLTATTATGRAYTQRLSIAAP